MHENNLSKATLLLGIEEVVKSEINTFYFPAYEIVVDDLRDYRFYDKDMVHPNSQAVDYIWEQFKKTFFSDLTNKLIEEIAKIVQASNHRSFDSNSEKHQQFLKNQLEAIKRLTIKLRDKYSNIGIHNFLQEVAEQCNWFHSFGSLIVSDGLCQNSFYYL